jgi:parallel beta helix pectate lyase-like protein
MTSHEEITVGAAGADIVGTDNRAIQTAIDALSLRGGGTVRVLPGEYVLHDAVRLASDITLLGDREKTILRRAPMVVSLAAIDPDGGEAEVTPEATSGFAPGMGIMIRDSARPNDMSVLPLRVERIAGGKLLLNDRLAYPFDFSVERGALITNHFPLVLGLAVEHVVVDGFTLDGTVSSTDGLDNLWSAGLYLRHARTCTVRNVVSHHHLGDGIQFGNCDYCAIEDCEAAHNTHYGVHPGSHSPWTEIRRSHIHHNGSDGLYVCWGVREGVIEDNEIHHNGFRLHHNGLSIGHKDTDNLIARNHIYENAKHGICFRVERESNGAHRNVLRENVIENNGRPEADVPEPLRADPRFEVLCCGIFVRGVTHDLTFERNTIRETRPAGQQHQHDGICLAQGVSRVVLTDNAISGHPGEAVVDNSHQHE